MQNRWWLAGALGLMCQGAFAADGEAMFKQTCAVCHQAGGVGSPGLAPPLANRELWEKLGANGPRYLAGVMLGGMSGRIEAAGVDYVGLVMPPQQQLDDEQLAAIGTYVLAVMNRSSETLDASAIRQLRSNPLGHSELRKIRRGAP